MKRTMILFAVILLSGMSAIALSAKSREQTKEEKETCYTASADCAGVIKAIDYYIEGGRKGSSTIAKKGFSETATMSWYENGKLQSVPIQTLYDLYDQPQTHNGKVTYSIISCEIAEDVAIIAIDSQFGNAQYIDMFTLVKDDADWKIVSKVYHTKK